MKFGVREICDVVFKTTTANQVFGTQTYANAYSPVLYIDSAKTSALEGAATTVYAQGGRGNTRLLAWEGEKTLTFTVEDALISPLGLSMLSGAGLYDATTGGTSATRQHYTATVTATSATGATGLTALELVGAVSASGSTAGTVYATEVDPQGAVVKFLGTATMATINATGNTATWTTSMTSYTTNKVMLDFYVTRSAATFQQIEIDAERFGGTFYVEASTLFRDQNGAVDLPAEIIIPMAKIQSNFTFNLASSGDPSTFSFVMDAFPAVIQGGTRKVLAAIQIAGQ